MAVSRFLTAVPLRELARVNRLLRSEFASGILVIAAAIIGILAANTAFADPYFALRDFRVGPAILGLDLPLGIWASDGLLAVFFFIVGLELKRELKHGALRNLRVAVIPVGAAFGGVLLPALIYLLCTAGSSAASGWAIPTATDIAFAVAVLGLIAPRIPPMLRVFLLTLAVVDDFIAITIIAVFYGSGVQWGWLALAVIPLAVFAAVVRYGAGWLHARPWLAWVTLLPLAIVFWALIHASGIHATVAGVLLAAVVPAGSTQTAAKVEAGSEASSEAKTAPAAPRRSIDLAETLSFTLSPLSNGIAVPIFAFFAAGVSFGAVTGFPTSPIAIGIILGLVIGKPLGILAVTAILTRVTGTSLGASWRELTGIGFLAGIGFTVALLVSQLSFATPADIDLARLSVMVASLIAAACAALLLVRPRRRSRSSRHAHS